MRSGVVFLVLAMLLTPAADGVAKAMSATYSPMTIAFLRYFASGLIALAVARASGRTIVVPAADRIGMAGRTVLIVGAMTALIAALGMVPMAKAVGGFLIAPIVSGLLGILIWGERPTTPRLAGSALAVVGAAMLMKPEAGLEPGCLCALGGGALLGAYLAATRGAKAQTDPLSTLAAQGLLGGALLAPLAFSDGLPALTPLLLGGALALGAISAICHLLTVAAYQRTEATALAPFLYFNMITATATGFLWFGESLQPENIFALAAIAFGGLLTVLPVRCPFVGILSPLRVRLA